jgi:hypothetical protein
MTHAWHDISPGANLPREFYAVIEIPFASSVKYELDKQSGLIKLDRGFSTGRRFSKVDDRIQPLAPRPASMQTKSPDTDGAPRAQPESSE